MFSRPFPCELGPKVHGTGAWTLPQLHGESPTDEAGYGGRSASCSAFLLGAGMLGGGRVYVGDLVAEHGRAERDHGPRPDQHHLVGL